MSYKLLYFSMFICGIIVLRIHYLNYRYIRYNDYLRRFNKSYSYEEFHERLVYFEESLEEIERLNHGKDKTGAVHGLTKLSDWSRKESNNILLKQASYNCRSKSCSCNETDTTEKCTYRSGSRFFGDFYTSSSAIERFRDPDPEPKDWRNEGVIGPVVDQKQCNCCWAVSIVGIMEAMAAIDNKGHDRLSIQQLIDCTTTYTHGCDGGDIDAVLEVMCSHKQSLKTEDQYPLMLVTERCAKEPYHGVRGVKNYEIFCDMQDADLLKKLVHGPVMAVVHPTGWMNYNSGIISRNCFDGTSGMVHVVQIVGFNTTTDEIGEEIKYYIAKNSWGSDWGENGYIRIARGKNLCGINDHIVALDVV